MWHGLGLRLPTLARAQAMEVAKCHQWGDGQRYWMRAIYEPIDDVGRVGAGAHAEAPLKQGITALEDPDRQQSLQAKLAQVAIAVGINRAVSILVGCEWVAPVAVGRR